MPYGDDGSKDEGVLKEVRGEDWKGVTNEDAQFLAEYFG